MRFPLIPWQAYLMLKQSPKARNHLKRVAKMQFLAEMADDFEQGWLMLADVYIGGGKRQLRSSRSGAAPWAPLRRQRALGVCCGFPLAAVGDR